MRWACLRACRSEPQIPQASVLTSTCPADGFGSGSVSATISPFLKMAARKLKSSSRHVIVTSHTTEGYVTHDAPPASVSAGDFVYSRSGVGRRLARQRQELRPPHP